MSTLLGEISKDKIIMASDSRLAVEENGVVYAVHDDAKKLFIIDDSFVFWGSGKIMIIDELVKKIKQSGFRDVRKIAALAQDIIDAYKKLGGKASDENGFLQFTIGQFKNGEPYVYLSGDKYGWQIIEQKGEDEHIGFGGGWGGHITIAEYYKDAEYSRNNFDEVAQTAFDLASDVHSGGTLTIVTMTKGGITEKRFDIDDSGKDVKWLPQNDITNGHCRARDLFLGPDQASVLSVINGISQIGGDGLNLRGIRIFSETTNALVNNWTGNGTHYMSVGAGTPTMPSGIFYRLGTIINGVAAMEMATDGTLRIRGDLIAGRVYASQPTADQLANDPAGTIRGVNIIGGSITSDSTVNVTTNATIGNRLNMTSTGLADGIHFTSTNASISLNDENTVRIAPFLSTQNLFTEGLAGLGYSGLTAAITDLRNRIIALENA
ncbi:MAG: hypothetical protein FWE04_01725 [Oscillospiraceae bacterium]|nr:hypothetical protein [Oscillospiraceae bacterium]